MGCGSSGIRIGGFVKQSLIDWEGVLAAVVFTKGCNLRCGYCHNPSLVIPALLERTPDIPEAEVLDYLARRRGWLEGVVVTGGEPTLQAGLPAFMRRVRALGYPIRLDTNGTHPEVVERLLAEGVVDGVAMDIKHLPEYEAYRRVTPLSETMMARIRRTIDLLRRSGVAYHFRTTVLPDLHTPEVRARLAELFAGDPYVEHVFRQEGLDGLVGDWIAAEDPFRTCDVPAPERETK